MPRPASTRCWIRSGSRGPTVVPIAVPASTVPTLMSVPTIAAEEDGRRHNGARMAAPDVLIVALGGTAGLRASDDALAGALRRGGASVALARVVSAREP